MKHKILLIVLLLGVVSLQAQEQQLSHGLGFAGGQVSGAGFSYRYLGSTSGFQVSLGVISSSNDYEDDFPEPYISYFDPGYPPPLRESYPVIAEGREIYGNIGFTLYRILNTAKRSRFYAFGGSSVFFTSTKEKRQEYGYTAVSGDRYRWGPTGDIEESRNTESTMYFGVGLGMEWSITENIRLSFEWPLTVSSDVDIYMYIPQGGLHYFFK